MAKEEAETIERGVKKMTKRGSALMLQKDHRRGFHFVSKHIYLSALKANSACPVENVNVSAQDQVNKDWRMT